MTALDVRHVVRTFGALHAVNDVTFSLAKGEVCGLVGPNGSGKTTLLNVISGVLPASSGSVDLDGVTLSGRPAHFAARSGVSRTFQLIRLIQDATVRENVRAGLYWQAPDRRFVGALTPFLHRRQRVELDLAVDAALERLAIQNLARSIVKEVPHGLQRRVELARAVVSRPQLLLLDEPAAGITDRDIEQVATLIGEESARGCSVLLVDHHLRFVLETCRRLVVMNFGVTIFDGSSADAVEDHGVREAYVGG